MRRTLVLLAVTIFAATTIFAQEKSTAKFGKITPEDFKPTVYSIDSSANAVVLADIGSTEITGNTKGGFSLHYNHYKRVHILNKNGYDIADVSIRLYANGSEEENLESLKAVTYNLEGGKVVETKLDTKKNVFKDKISKNWVVKKFTFPNIKEGSIIEFEYKIESDFLFNLQPWEFQGSYPRIWSEYNVSIPAFFRYVFITQGYHSYDINNRSDRRESFNIIESGGTGASEHYQFDANVTDYRWVIKNVPVLKEENFTSTLDNHISKIEFQLSEQSEPLTYHRYMGSWMDLTKRLMEDEDFGESLQKDNNWIGDYIGSMVKTGTNLEKAKRIYAYVRDKFTCTDHSSKYLSQSLKNVAKSNSGSDADINLLLVAMLRYANIDADPVILSTRSNGYSNRLYPLISQFNYVIVQAKIDSGTYYLDASLRNLGFGKLSSECYNGQARVINETAALLEFDPNKLVERKFSSIFMINGEKGGLSATMQQAAGYFESYSIRQRIKDKGKEELFKDIKKAYPSDIEISNEGIDSLDQLENEIGIHYDFDMKPGDDDLLYFNPMFGEGYKENPF
ncbi:MAG: DUF3857 domain-containing protein, partial [Bacteroidetes bacterium]|nr:DUF3857 domain-containing protein [Bacteroidota bacterium]